VHDDRGVHFNLKRHFDLKSVLAVNRDLIDASIVITAPTLSDPDGQVVAMTSTRKAGFEPQHP
jgi:hypothetical protein